MGLILFQVAYKSLRNETMQTRKENSAGREASLQLDQEVTLLLIFNCVNLLVEKDC